MFGRAEGRGLPALQFRRTTLNTLREGETSISCRLKFLR
ncbi:hypothetical protein Y027_2299 [Burkholderia pseudomallei TSV5]|nr:hypothetical protein X990_3093 [Burkholderia pseudomallei MSHR4868]KGX61695.1 hypothetical protein Y027_2299 [Burkholderia pseudomallei TSV5]KGX63192.1 hypothetical protein Y024_2402 [Burkholderia pseudomallei TSV44]